MKIYKETVNESLWKILTNLMEFNELKKFRLVGGTSLSLMLGHRISVDIDLFTDEEYGSIDFNEIDSILRDNYKYVTASFEGNAALGKSYFIGHSERDAIKLDLFYTDQFVYPLKKYSNLRLSSLEEIIAMKLEVIGQNGRKKDFWDIHELMDRFSLNEMYPFYKHRYPYGYSRNEIFHKLIDFKSADIDFDPICLRGKYWELIKIDIQNEVNKQIKN